jgi:hypothetical protein
MSSSEGAIFHVLTAPARRVATCVPCWPGVDLLPSALAATKAPSDLGDYESFREGVHVHVGRVPASLAPRNQGAHAVLPHIRERHRGSEILAACVGHCRIAFGRI